MKLDPKIDALFQLSLDEFTKKRNALAKELSGESKKQIKFLTKPPLPIWAVNQLYWRDKPTYNALVDASEKLRAAHRAALSGKKADIRKAEQVHHAALDKAMAKTLALAGRSQGGVSDAARDTIRKTLAALPTEEEAGRMTREPQAAGFSLLTGITPRDTSTVGRDFSRAVPKKERGLSRALPEPNHAAEKALAAKAAAREKAIAAAERDLQQARKAAEQAKFKVRKLTVELERAQADEEKRAASVSTAEQRLSRLKIAD